MAKNTFNPAEMATALKNADIIKKISAKTVFGTIGNDIKGKLVGDTEVVLFRVVGQARTVKTGTTDKGEWLAFRGDFVAVNMDTGKSFRASTLFLPAVAQDIVEVALIGAEGGSVNLAFDIAIVGNEASAVGYEYRVRALLPVTEADPLLMLCGEVENASKESK